MKKILLIDDSGVNLFLIKLILEDTGYECDVVANGEDAIKILEEREEDFGLVIIDIVMPIMNEMKILEEIRNFSNIPVSIVTENKNRLMKKSTFKIKANSYHTQPVTKEEILKVVQKYIL
jgi:CheY-like chemotaxis protein